MLTITGNGRLTRDPELRHTQTGTPVCNLSVASDRRDRDADPVYLELVLWERAAQAAAAHLVKGQSVSFSGRAAPRLYTTRDGEPRVALEAHGVDLEYGPRPRRDPAPADPEPATEPVAAAAPQATAS